MTPLSSFKTAEEELEYFKRHAKNLEDDLSETKYALEEFQLSSKELEEELEKEIDSTERRYNEIKIRNEAMRQEAEEWKVKNMLSFIDVVCVWMLGGLWFSEEFCISIWIQLLRMSIRHNTTRQTRTLLVILPFLNQQ